MTDEHACHYCGPTERALRPYGPGGAPVCLPCAKASPERWQEVIGRFRALCDAVSAVSPGGLVVVGLEVGPVPFNPFTMRRR